MLLESEAGRRDGDGSSSKASEEANQGGRQGRDEGNECEGVGGWTSVPLGVEGRSLSSLPIDHIIIIINDIDCVVVGALLFTTPRT